MVSAVIVTYNIISDGFDNFLIVHSTITGKNDVYNKRLPVHAYILL